MKNTLCLIIASMALPALAQSDPSEALPSPTPLEANPFNDSISVTLTAGGNAEMRWDYGTTSALMGESDGKPYDSTTPIKIKSTGILRTIAIFNGMGVDPKPANYSYTKNIKPTVSFTSPTSTTPPFRPGQTVNLAVNVTDPDGPQPLTVHFYRVNGQVRTELPGSPLLAPPYTLAWPLDAAAPIGSIPLRAVVRDAKGLEDSTSVSITINANKAPTVTLSPANGSSFIAPATVTLTATPADQDGSITKVAFFKGTDSLGEDIAGPPWTSAPISLAEGVYALKAVAYDNGLPVLTGSATSNITVSRNNPPKITIALNAPAGGGSVYYAPFAGKISANASDSDGGVTEVKFYTGTTLDSTDLTSPWGYSKSFPAGHYSLTAKATDAFGLSTTSDSLVFTVAANQKPTAKTGNDTTIYSPTASVQMKGNGSTDPEGTALKYKWSGPVGVTFNNDTLANPVATFPANNFNAFAIQLKVTDRGEPPLSDSMKLTVNAWDRPKITSPTSAGAAVNQNFTYVITGTGFPAPTFDAPTKPSWLTYNAATATLSGKPSSQGNAPVTLTAQSLAGSDTKTLTITVGDSLYKPTITSALSWGGKVGAGFGYNITARGNPSNFTYNATGLPTGLYLSGSSILGTPTNSGNFTVTLTVTNSLGFDRKSLVLTVTEVPKITQDLPDTVPAVFEKTSVSFSVLADGFPGVSYQWQFSQNPATTAYSPVGTGSSATYTINPTNTANSGYYRVIVKNSVGEDTSKACRLKVNPIPAPVKISQAPTAQTAVVGDRVIFKAKATGEPLPLLYRWYRGYPTRTPVTSAKADDTVLTLDSAKVAMNDLYSVRATSSNFTGDSTNPAYYAWSDTARLTVQLPKLAKPVATPPGGTIYAATPVALTAPVGIAAIWYTLNGQEPIAGPPSIQYLGAPISIDSTRTLKAKAFANQYRPSDAITEIYTLTAPNKSAKPAIWPVDSTFRGSLALFMSAADGSEIYYSLQSADSVVSNRKFTDSIVIKTTTLVKAVATKAGYIPSDTAVRLFTLEKPRTNVLDPQFTPDGGSFTGSLIVKIASPTPGAVVHYTDDGTDPDSTSPIATERGIQISKTTTLKAIGTLKEYGNSAIIARDFRLGPGNIAATPAGDWIFDEVVDVKLSVSPPSAAIRYTLDGSAPTEESPIYPAGGKSFSTTVTISAIAYLDGQPGNLQTFSYTRKGGPLITPIPTTAGNAFTFKNTISITLQTTPGAKIYYTIDGSEPSFIAANLYKQAIVLDNTATIQAVAVADGFENSKVLVATYTLVPEKPEIKPPGGSYPLPFNAQISSTSRAAAIYYTLDGTAPTPDNGYPYTRNTNIPITMAGSLRAVAVAGNMASEIATEEYGAIRYIDTLLVPGNTLFLYGGYTLRNPEDQSASVHVHTGSPLIKGLTGFDGVQYMLNLAPENPSGTQAFPKLAFTTPASDKRSLYKVEASGKIYFVSSGDSVTLGAGTWFMGNDTLPPTVRYVSETFDASDSTRVIFEVKDNVANLGYNLIRNDNPARNVSGAFLFSEQAIMAILKHPDSAVKPLYVQMSVSDFLQTAYFPADKSTMLPLSQKLKPLQGPPAWMIGVRPENRYDFVSVPLALEPPLTLEGLSALNPAAAIEGAEFRISDNKFHPLPKETALLPGQGYWIAARAPVTSLRMPSAATASSGGKANYSVALHTGWNQISNPHLETLYWPSARILENYRTFTVKGLWGWEDTLAKPDYVQSDSLVPWRGYFVYNWAGDTVIPLLTSPRTRSSSAPPAAGKSATENRIQMSLGWNDRPTLSLGADPLSADGFGMEDEVSLPQQGNRFLRAMRNGRGLASDWVRLNRAQVQVWSIQFGSAGDSLPSLHVPELLLPADYEAWAVSDSRGMKFAMVPGASIPASGLAKDSLRVLAGPKEILAGLLDGLSASAPRLDAKLSAAADGFRLRLGLPSRARVLATLWSLQGSRLGTLSTGLLSEGNYEFSFAGDFGNRPARLGPGMYVLTVDVRGRDVSARLSRKLFLAR